MKFSHFFIDRPVFAWVLTIVILLVGGIAFLTLPVAQYPEIAPPSVQVSAVYPGANARVVADTVATPIEQEVNGVEGMLYMSSQCTNDGTMNLTVTFALGTDLDMAQVLVQNRVSIAEAKLPEEVRRQGVTVKKKSPSILLVVNLISPDSRYDQLYLSNYATIQVKDALSRVEGVGDVLFLGARDYSMRVWVDPEQLAARDMTAGDVMGALREQNVQVAAGRLGQPPAPSGQAFQYTISTLGRLVEPSEFAEIILKYGDEGEITRLGDVARIELGARNYDVASTLDGQPTISLGIFQLPGSNALATAEGIRAQMDELRRSFPEGLDYEIVYDTTVFVEESIREVYKTIFEAFVLVFLVVLVFLQDWKATILPMIEVPLCLIGTFAVMALLGFSLNNLTLFGLILAIGIVVDDAIVVIENVERWMERGFSAPEATRRAMDEVTGPVIATSLVLCSVFIPTAFLAGISGQFYRQFALTIAASTVISAFNALTLTPARCAQMFATDDQSGGHGLKKEAMPRWGIALLIGILLANLLEPWLSGLLGLDRAGITGNDRLTSLTMEWGPWVGLVLIGSAIGWPLSRPINQALGVFLKGFNWVFERITGGYGGLLRRLLRISFVMLVVYAGLIGLTVLGFRTVPTGFIPEQDKGYFVANVQLPEGASLERTEAVVARMTEIALETPGVAHTIGVPGYSLLTNANLSNVGGMFIILEPFEERVGRPELGAPPILDDLRQRFSVIQEGLVAAFPAAPVEGMGSTGGFKLQIQDRGARGFDALQAATQETIQNASEQPGLVGLFSSFRADQPQLYVDINRTQAKQMGVALSDIFDTLQVYLGSAYANDFTFENRNWQVNVQADAAFRNRIEDIGRLKVRNAGGEMVPLGGLIDIQEVTGPSIVNHYNMYPSAEINGNTLPGVGSGVAIQLMEQVAEQTLPQRFGLEWTDLTYQQILADQDFLTKLVFPLAVIFVFLVLAAQYESWSMPLAVILIVPMCLLAAISGIMLRGMDNNIFTQIGFVVLVGLASKNAILIVEFARARRAEGEPTLSAVLEASTLRFRPILMTSFAFILGVLPLVLATGAGFEMRQALGTAVFSGMIGVTLFGLIFTPIFFYVLDRYADRQSQPAPPAGPPLTPAPTRDEPASVSGASEVNLPST